MDPTPDGDQPFSSSDIAVAANGEIYNFRQLYSTLKSHVDSASGSDSEVIMHLYREIGDEVVCRLDGMFAFGE